MDLMRLRCKHLQGFGVRGCRAGWDVELALAPSFVAPSRGVPSGSLENAEDSLEDAAEDSLHHIGPQFPNL